LNKVMHVSQDFHSTPIAYCMRIRGHLDQDWSAWFDGTTIRHEPDGTTVLAGSAAGYPLGEAALYGLLSKARDLGLTLLSVECTTEGDSSTENT
jgi:hypothetical protein